MIKSRFKELLENNSDLKDTYVDFVNDACGPSSESEFEFKDGSKIKFKCLKQFGGEGLGDSYWVVFSVTDEQLNETTNYKIDGWYASHYGYDFSNYLDFHEVEPVEVTVIEWREKQQ